MNKKRATALFSEIRRHRLTPIQRALRDALLRANEMGDLWSSRVLLRPYREQLEEIQNTSKTHEEMVRKCGELLSAAGAARRLSDATKCYIDPVAGDDSAAGTSDFPIKTYAEMVRRSGRV